MATQKQRKRRAKEKRHDYELVYVDEEGVERPVEREEAPRKPVGRGSKGDRLEDAEVDLGAGRARAPAGPPSHPRGARCSSAVPLRPDLL